MFEFFVIIWLWGDWIRDFYLLFDNFLDIFGNFLVEKCLKLMQIILVKE